MGQDTIAGKKVVVTGAAGFIGSHVVDALLDMGNDVIGLDNFYNGRITNLSKAMESPRFTLQKGDIRDPDLLLRLFTGTDLVYHEAAFTSVPQSIEMPHTCNQVNVEGTLNVLNAARRCDVAKVIFASSSSVYGDTVELPKHEAMPTVPISPYGVSKQAGEFYVRAYHHVYGLDTTALRYFNVFGPRQRDSPYSGVIAIFFGKLARGEPLTIFGDGKQSRDFTYVKDVVRANILAATVTGAAGGAFNIAASAPITLDDLASTMIAITGKQGTPINHAEPRKGDILHSYADITLAKKVLGYEPRFTPVTGLQDYLLALDEHLQEKDV